MRLSLIWRNLEVIEMKKTAKKSSKKPGAGKKRSDGRKGRITVIQMRRELREKYGDDAFERFSEGLYIDPIWSEPKPGKR